MTCSCVPTESHTRDKSGSHSIVSGEDFSGQDVDKWRSGSRRLASVEISYRRRKDHSRRRHFYCRRLPSLGR